MPQPPCPKASNPILYIPSIIWNTSEAHWTLPLQKSWAESAQIHTTRLVVPWCHLLEGLGPVWPQHMQEEPSPWPPALSYVSRQIYKTPRHTMRLRPCLGMIWVPMTLNLSHWDKLTRYTLGWVGAQCERQSLNHPAPRPQTQSYTSHQSFGTPLKPIGHCLCRNLGRNQLKSTPRGLLCHGATFWRVWVQCGPNICKRTHPHGLQHYHMYPGKYTKHQDTPCGCGLVLV